MSPADVLIGPVPGAVGVQTEGCVTQCVRRVFVLCSVVCVSVSKQVRHLSAIYLRMKINDLWIRFTSEQQLGIKAVCRTHVPVVHLQLAARGGGVVQDHPFQQCPLCLVAVAHSRAVM
jgi:hypothetical protein